MSLTRACWESSDFGGSNLILGTLGGCNLDLGTSIMRNKYHGE